MHNRRFAVKPHCGLRMWGIAKAPSREAFELLTMHGVEKPIVLDVQFLGRGKDPWGNERAGFHAATTINRKDWGLNWNEVLETGGFLVGDDVTIEVNAEGLAEK